MRNQFVETENVSRFHMALTALRQRGAAECCLVVIDGVPGLGKTTVLNHWVAHTGSIYMRAKVKWSASWMMRELLERLNVPPQHKFETNFKTALAELGARLSSADLAKRDFGIVIDEADHISRNREMIDTLRDLSDQLEIPILLVGMGKIRDNLSRFPQIASRVQYYVRFEQASEKDVRRFVDSLCEVPVDDSVVRFIHKATAGHNREIKEAIANIERFGRCNPPAEGERLTLSDLTGQMIVNDRRNVKAIRVPEEL